MTLNSKIEKNYNFRDGWYTSDGNVVSQSMFFMESAIRKFKGIRRILQERHLWVETMRLECKAEKGHNCCARHVLDAQPDFREQKTALESEVLARDHIFTMYPKFHCECNFIERYWGSAKRTARQDCDYSFKSLCQKLPIFLDQVPLAVIRRFARKAWRYIDAYDQGMNAKLAEFTVKKYKSHRRIPRNLDQRMEE